MKQRSEFEDVEEYVAYLEMWTQHLTNVINKQRQDAIAETYRGNPDRMGGQFTEEELNRPDRL